MISRQRLLKTIIYRAYSGPSKPSSGKSSEPSAPNVTGLSERCVKVTPEPVGPGATTTGEYKVPEYFCFNRLSYYEAEVEMAKFRCPQPSAVEKTN